MRYSKRAVVSSFKTLARLYKKSTEPWKKVGDKWIANVGAWQLSHSPLYGGFVVEELYNKEGGITHPFGPMRRSPREFVDFVDSIIRGLKLYHTGTPVGQELRKLLRGV